MADYQISRSLGFFTFLGTTSLVSLAVISMVLAVSADTGRVAQLSAVVISLIAAGACVFFWCRDTANGQHVVDVFAVLVGLLLVAISELEQVPSAASPIIGCVGVLIAYWLARKGVLLTEIHVSRRGFRRIRPPRRTDTPAGPVT
jgi:hypothetical protein